MRRIVAEVSDETYARLFKKKADEGYGDKDWGEWLTQAAKGTELEPTTNMRVRVGTKGLLPMWCKSFSLNLPMIREGMTLREIVVQDPPPPPDNRAIVIGRGPSLFKHNHLKLLAETKFHGTIIACDGVLIDCLREGLIPDYVLSIDGSPVIKKYFDDSLVERYAKDIKLVLCSQVNHEVAELVTKQGFKIYWVQPSLDYISPRNSPRASITEVLTLLTCSDKNPDGLVSIEAGGNVGSCSWIFTFNILKRTDIALIGFDFGYPEDMELKDTYYYDKTVDAVGPLRTDTFYERIFHPTFGTWSRIDPVFMTYRDSFLEMVLARPSGYRLVNATEGGTIFAPSMECMKLEDWIKEKD